MFADTQRILPDRRRRLVATARLRSLLRRSTLYNTWDSKSPVPQGTTERGFNWRSANCGAALSYSSGIRFRSVFASRHSARTCYRECHEKSRHTGRLFVDEARVRILGAFETSCGLSGAGE